MKRSRCLLCLILLGAVLATGAIGCSGNASVSGTLLVDGEPVEGLEMDFSPTEPELEGGGTAYTDAQGAYEAHTSRHMEGIAPGKYVVRVMTGDQDYDYEDEDGEAPAQRLRIPAKYNSNSELIVEVTGGKNVFDFDLDTTKE